jgi:hypothetical protein
MAPPSGGMMVLVRNLNPTRSCILFESLGPMIAIDSLCPAAPSVLSLTLDSGSRDQQPETILHLSAGQRNRGIFPFRGGNAERRFSCFQFIFAHPAAGCPVVPFFRSASASGSTTEIASSGYLIRFWHTLADAIWGKAAGRNLLSGWSQTRCREEVLQRSCSSNAERSSPIRGKCHETA